jgi:phosphatidylserine/phosphatidylglycerophosphate/cardiolipin synthase-like enzyme/uncharacterized membrane protein YdjX (TVP38/TMEM64 family)
MVQLGWRTHRRLDFRLDGEHPLGASHHQKIVVVDDAVAFVGGLDLTVNRWDTSDHSPVDPRRVDPGGRSYPPFHDVQVAVSGPAAAALGTLARERWWRATGERLAAPRAAGDPWPPRLAPDLENVTVALARTEPAFAGRAQVREVERLHLDAIAAARRCIYIENQYFTSARIAEALAARLEEPDGPEVVLVLPRACSGWLEEGTMGVLRGRVLCRLREADRHGRLGVYYPRITTDGICLNVHAKLVIVDDQLVRIASSNLSSRSMGLDTECDLAIEAADEPHVTWFAASLRSRLVAEHLGVPLPRVTGLFRRTGSLLQTIEALRGAPRTLEPLVEMADGWLARTLPAETVLDLERPVEHAPLLGTVLPRDLREPAMHATLRLVRVLAAVAVLAALWEWWRLDAALDAPMVHEPSVPLLVVLGFLCAGAFMVPLTIPTLATLLALGAWPGLGWALVGALASALAGWLAGRVLWRRWLRRFAGRHVERLARRVGRRTVGSLAKVRLLPVAPFTMASIVCGALGARLDRYLLGTLLGIAPGVLVLTGLVWLVRG